MAHRDFSTLTLIEQMPASIDELPRWFDSLTDEELDTVWVSAVTHFLGGDDIKFVARALVAVRERARQGAFTSVEQLCH